MTTPPVRRYFERGGLIVEQGSAEYPNKARLFPGTVIWVKEWPYTPTEENITWMKHHAREGWNWRWLIWSVNESGIRVCKPAKDNATAGLFHTVPINEWWVGRIGRMYKIGWWLTREYQVVGHLELETLLGKPSATLPDIFKLDAPGYAPEQMPYGYPEDITGFWYQTSSGERVNIVERDWLSKQGWYVKNEVTGRRWYIRTQTLAIKLQDGTLFEPLGAS